MDKLVESFDFQSTTSDRRLEFYDNIEAIFKSRQTTPEVIKRTVDAIASKLSVPEFPPDKVESIFAMNCALDFVLNKWDRNRPDIGADAFRLYLTCLEAGPTSGHITIMKTLKGYIKPLQIEDARRLMVALRRPYNPVLSEPSREKYITTTMEMLVRALREMIKWDTADIKKPLGDDVADLVSNLEQLLWMVPPDVAEVQGRLLGEIDRLFYYDKSYTMFVSDILIISKQLTMMEDLATNNTDPSPRALKGMKDWAWHFATLFKEKPEFTKPVFVNILQVMCAFLHQSSPELHSAANNLANGFNAINDTSIWLDKADEVFALLVTTFGAVANRNLTTDFSNAILTTFRFILMVAFRDKSQAPGFCKVLARFIESGSSALGGYVEKSLRDKAKYMNWKENIEGMIDIAKAMEVLAHKTLDNDARGKAASCMSDVCGRFGEQLKIANMIASINPIIIPLCVEAIEKPGAQPLTSIAYKLASFALWNLDIENCTKYLDGISKLVQMNFDIFGLKEYEIHGVTAIITGSIYKCLEQVSEARLGFKIISNVKVLFESACAMPMVDEVSGHNTTHYAIVLHIITFYMKSGDDVRCVAPLADLIVEQMSKNESKSIRSSARSLGLMAIKKHMDILTRVSPQLIDVYLKEDDVQLLMTLTECYPRNASTVDGRMNDFMEKFEASDETQSNRFCLLQLFKKMASQSPTVFTVDVVNKLSKCFDNVACASMLCMIYTVLAETNPQLIIGQIKAMEEAFKLQDGIFTSMVAQCWTTAALHDKKAAEIVLPRLISLISSSPNNQKISVVFSIKTIGQKYGLLAKYKDVFISLKSTPELTETCQSILDIIEGRSLAGLSEEMTDQKVEIKQVTERVIDTEVKVENIAANVAKQGQEISHVKTGLSNVTGRVDRAEENIEEINVKVEEVDHKTMNNAPAWSRDISKLLNPPSEGRDWRLLAARLGYSNNDIRNWATQHDPTMAVLSEFYSTHNTREATHGVLKALQEMNRLDAAAIVEKALKEAENVVADEVVENGPLPVVFLSYQWSHQQQVKLLRQHLESAGYRCWIDLGQMGGGDKLYAKIDSGMRATKVVICCVTEEYAKSDNCNREVGLAVTLGKPIIPLLFENMSWPPAGAMGPIFGEYLFVRFFCRPKEVTGDSRFWPIPKFGELLGQIRYHAAPDTTIVKKDYENWWQPKEEVIIIPQVTNTKEASTKGSEQKTNSASSIDSNISPQIFLSYQWDKQPQIQALYRRLTSHGYTCWLDINQMGGGDSLYDKIDRGVRGCQVVVSCVTPKYAMSANCRKEVSLADAIKKPIIPLLLDEMAWPPEGPMGMIFTQALYIAFHKNPESQTAWQGSEFNQLLEKIKTFVPLLSTDVNTNEKVVDKKMPEQFSKYSSPSIMTQVTVPPNKILQGYSLPKSGEIAAVKAHQNGVADKQSTLSASIKNNYVAQTSRTNNLWDDDDNGNTQTTNVSKAPKPVRLSQPAVARNWRKT